jgi:hypothetical protein
MTSPRPLIIAVAVMLAVALGMSAYVWRMRDRAEIESSASFTQPVAPPVSGTSEQVTLYVAYDDPGVLLAQRANVPLPEDRQQRAQQLLRTLLSVYLDKSSPHRLGAGSDLRDVYLVDSGLAVIDLNADFANGHRSGILVEELTVASLVQTLSANIAGIVRVKILVDGEERNTLAGHADLSGSYDVSGISQMASGLQPSQ